MTSTYLKGPLIFRKLSLRMACNWTEPLVSSVKMDGSSPTLETTSGWSRRKRMRKSFVHTRGRHLIRLSVHGSLYEPIYFVSETDVP